MRNLDLSIRRGDEEICVASYDVSTAKDDAEGIEFVLIHTLANIGASPEFVYRALMARYMQDMLRILEGE